jgi:hypothetical protein
MRFRTASFQDCANLMHSELLQLLKLLFLPFHACVDRSLQEVALKKQEDGQNRQHHQRGVREQGAPFNRVRSH